MLPQSCRIFARIRTHNVIQNPGSNDFVHGMADASNHPFVKSVFFDTYSFNGKHMHVGPATLPPADPLLLKVGDILWGVAVYQQDQQKYAFRWCTNGAPLHYLCGLLSKTPQSVRDARDRLSVLHSGRMDESLYLTGLLLTGDLVTVFELTKMNQAVKRVRLDLNTVDVVDFVRTLALFCQKPVLFLRFAGLVRIRKDEVSPSILRRCTVEVANNFEDAAAAYIQERRSWCFQEETPKYRANSIDSDSDDSDFSC